MATSPTTSDIATLPGLSALWQATQGDAEICVAVIDGAPDQSHPCFAGANLRRLPTLVSEQSGHGLLSMHGTHVTSVIFAQHHPQTLLKGIAPKCRGLLLPLFSDQQNHAPPQLDLARTINQALAEGAHVINISGGQKTTPDTADPMLVRAIEQCAKQNVLVVAAAGNDACRCEHVPAALASVLAVGAMGKQGQPIAYSNWGEAYQKQGIMALGEQVLGAVPSGRLMRKSGTSFATPIVSGIAALLLSLQLQRGEKPNPQAIRDILLASATPCDSSMAIECQKFLKGTLNIAAAHRLVKRGAKTAAHSRLTVLPSRKPATRLANSGIQAAEAMSIPEIYTTQLVYALGLVRYDFATETQLESFSRLMPRFEQTPPNPHDPRQMVAYLRQHPSEASELVWTLQIGETPIYAIQPQTAFAKTIYQALINFLDKQANSIVPEAECITHVSLPGYLNGSTRRLLSGEVVFGVTPQERGLYGWNNQHLLAQLIDDHAVDDAQRETLRDQLSRFLNRIYYDADNLGQLPTERALNYAATNAFQVAVIFRQTVPAGYVLDRFEVARSSTCRRDSDCWNVKLYFYHPTNVLRAKWVFSFTVDVRCAFPVLVGAVRQWHINA